jgi:2-polyprenyl-3-methyl-5-hydroxy-6-metoxy-1,4-benzoquinol methylase
MNIMVFSAGRVNESSPPRSIERSIFQIQGAAMSSCCGHAAGAGRFFSFFASNYRKRYLKKGFEPSQKQLITGLEQAGLDGAALLEVGCGVGYLHQHLLEKGAATATGIDLSEKMIAEAERLARERNLADRVHYLPGDFIEQAGAVDNADIVLLDKVICCYPDAHALVQQSLDKAQRVVALTIPRKRWVVQFGMAAMNTVLWLLRSQFRGYVHDPQAIERWITARGFSKVYENRTLAWLTQVFVRKSESN